jgi:hypothetical protein
MQHTNIRFNKKFYNIDINVCIYIDIDQNNQTLNNQEEKFVDYLIQLF